MEFEKTRGLGTADKEVDAPARPRRAAAPKKLQEVLSGSDSEPVADDDEEEEEEEEDSESEVEYASDASEDEEEEGIKKRQRKVGLGGKDTAGESKSLRAFMFASGLRLHQGKRAATRTVEWTEGGGNALSGAFDHSHALWVYPQAGHAP